MAITRFDRPAELPPIDFGFLAQQQQIGETRRAKADEDFDALFGEINKIKAVDQDVPLRNEIVSGYNDKLKSWVDKYGNNPVQGISELRNLKRDFNKEFYYGQLGDIHNKGVQYEETVKKFNEAAQKGNFKGMEDVAYYNIVQKPLESYEGSKQVGSGVYNKIGFGSPVEYANLGDDFSKFAQQWAASKKHGSLQRMGHGYVGSISKEYVDPSEVIEGVMQLAASDPKYATQLGHLSNYYQRQVDASTKLADAGDGNLIPYTEALDERGNLVYAKPSSGEQKVKEHIFGIANAIGMREGFEKLDPTYLQDWQQKFNWEEAAKKKTQEAPVTYITPSYQTPTSYWEDKNVKVSALASGKGTRPYTNEEIEELYKPYGGREGLAKLPGTRAESIENMITQKINKGKVIPKAVDSKGNPALPEDMKEDLNKAAILFKGRDVNGKPMIPENYQEQIKLIQDYNNYSRDRMLNMNALGPRNPEDFNELSTAYNTMYFGDPAGSKGKGSFFALSQPIKVIGGSGEEQTGADVVNEYSNLQFKYQGDLPYDNPFYSAGRIFVGMDPSTNKEIVRIAVPASNEEQANSQLINTMYQPKHTGESVKIRLPDNSGKVQEYVVDYERESGQELTNEYKPMEEGKGTAYLKDAKGNVVVKFNSGDVDPVTGVSENDAVKGLYNAMSVFKK